MTTTTPPQDADHDPAPAWWQDMVAGALPTVPAPASAADEDDDLVVLLDTIPAPAVPVDTAPVPPAAPAVPPMPTAPPVAPPQAADAPSADTDDTADREPVPDAVPVDTAPAPKKPKKAKTAPAAEPEPEPAEEVVHPWWSIQQRRALADRMAYQVAGDHAAGAAARVAPIFDLPETEEKAEKKLSAKKRARLREAAGVDRARRFRRWCTLTVLSAGLGSEIGLPQAIGGTVRGIWSTAGMWAGTGAAGFFIATTWALDWYLRGGTRENGATPVSLVKRGRIPVLIVVRVPVASALVAGLGADGMLAATTHAVHQLFA